MPSDHPLRDVAFRLSPSPLLVQQMRREGGCHLLGSIIDCRVTMMGGDEFVVVCDSLETSSESAIVAERIRVALDEPFGIQGRPHALSGSIGVAQTSDPSTAPEDLLRRGQADFLRAHDCDMAQGYLFGSPTRVEVAS